MRLAHVNAGLGLLLSITLLGAPVTAGAQGSGEANDLRTYGTAAKTFVALSPWHFVPADSTVTYQVNTAPGGAESISRTNTSGGSELRAPLNLPDGALVTELEAVFCDTSTTASFSLSFWIHPRMAPRIFGGSGPFSDAVSTPGCVDRTTPLNPPVTIDNNHNAYYLVIQLFAHDTTIQFSSARVGYVLQVSQAPATATFTDVPTNHPFFPFVEALVAAGITSGCSTSPPMFCPDNFVSRGQMAKFISEALGLQFAP